MKTRLVTIFLLFAASISFAQELNCNITINTQQIQSSDKKIYNTLQGSIYEFMNNTRWTSDNFENHERIECSMQITIDERVSNDEFRASIQVQSRRPVYKTSYYTPMLSINDENFTFRYIEFQTIEFNENASNPNLASILAFYAYVIIGMDYDSFSPNGGSPYFQKAQNIVANMQNSPEKGWRAFETTRNRFWLAENLNNPVFKPMRDFTYTYHRKGLDIMTDKRDDAISMITFGLESLKKLHNDKPNSHLMQIIFFTKADELVNVFSQAFPDVKAKVVTTLNEIDPANGIKYDAILNRN